MRAWVRPAASQPNSFGDILGKGYDSSQNDDELEMRESGGGFHAGTYTGTAGDKGPAYSPATTNWTHLVCTWDGTNWNLYVNGKKLAVAADTVGALNFSDPWAIGDGTVSGNGRLFKGGICQAALYTNALMPAEVLMHYSAGLYGTNGPPQIVVDAQNPFYALQGGVTSNAVAAFGASPLAYQWQFNGRNLADSNGIIGSASNVLTIGNAQSGEAGAYQCVITNLYGSATSSAASLIIGAVPVAFNTFNSNAAGWTTNQLVGSGPYGSTPFYTNGMLTLTDGNANEDRSFFFALPQYIGAFKAAWSYLALTNGADGTTFCLQDDPRGTSAIGGGGGGLGVSGITPSAELEFNLYTGGSQLVGYAFHTNGLTGAGGANGNYQAPGNINIAGGHSIGVALYYNGAVLSMTLTDAVANLSFNTNLFVGSLAQVLGSSTAYIGFTGSDGGAVSDQIISNFSFVSIPTETVQTTGTNAIVISWPQAVAGCTLQANATLETSNWVNVTNPVNVVNGQDQVVIPAGATNEFFRLQIQ